MLRRSILALSLVSAMLAGAWHLVPAQQAGTGQGAKTANVPKKLENWTFEVGQINAARVSGTRVPPSFNAKVAAQVNTRGAQWLAADVKARDAFAAKNPGVLPGQKVQPRVDPAKFSAGTKFDWRDYNKVTAVRDQGQCGSCWDFAAIGAYECNYLIRNNVTIDAAEQQILDCSGAGSCDGGFSQEVFDYLVKQGTCAESAYPYQAKKNASCKNVTSPYKAVSWGFVAPNGAVPSTAAMKTALCQHGPLAVNVNATDAFQHYTGGVFNEYASGAIDHAVLLVGWDDNKGKGAWLIRNSWTSNWGEKGYMWIEYGCNLIGDHACWVESESVHYNVMTLTANDYKVQQGQEIVVPIYLTHPTDVKNMDWTLHFDTNIATLATPNVVQGNLPMKLWEKNTATPGVVRMGFSQSAELISKDGTVALIRFKAVGAPGTITPLTLYAGVMDPTLKYLTTVNDAQRKQLPIKLIHGSIEIVADHTHIPKGCCFGNMKPGIEDARCALQMSVGNRPQNLNMDVDNSGRVDSLDAALILQMVLDQTRTGQ